MSLLDDINELNGLFEALLKSAHKNEHTLRKFQAFEIELINCGSAPVFFEKLLTQSRQDFNWDIITLALVDPEYGIRRLLTHGSELLEENSDILFLEDTSSLDDLFTGKLKTYIGTFEPEQHDFLFPAETDAPASVVIMPLIHHRELAGSFNIGCLDENRFNESYATDFLNHLAAVITVCLENLLSREHLKYLGLIDNLTGVNNRRFFEQRLREETSRVKRSNIPISCLFIDIDYFKKINDTHGHPVGDEVLRHVARIIREQVRNIDIVSRYGGEEFTVILLQSDGEKSQEIAERIRVMIEHSPYLKKDGEPVPLTASIGINTLLPDQVSDEIQDTARVFVERADLALYSAKNSGRNRTVCYSPALHDSAG